MKLHSDASVSCLRSNCLPFRTQPGMLYTPSGSHLFLPLILSTAFLLSSPLPCWPLFYPSWVVGLAPLLSPLSFLSTSSSPPSPASLFIPFSQAPPPSSRLAQLRSPIAATHTPSVSLSSKGLRLIQTASPRNGLTTRILGVTILLTQPRKQSWVWGPDLEPACTTALAVPMQELRAPGTRKPLPGPVSRNSPPSPTQAEDVFF